MSLQFWRKTRDVAPDNAQSVAVTEATPLPVQIFNNEDEDTPRVQVVAGLANIGKVDPNTATPTLYNVTCTVANTEYPQALPANCRGFDMQPRTNVDVRFAFVTGKVAGSTAPFATMKAGAPFNSRPLAQDVSPSTIYVASATAGTVVEIVAWT